MGLELSFVSTLYTYILVHTSVEAKAIEFAYMREKMMLTAWNDYSEMTLTISVLGNNWLLMLHVSNGV